MKVERPPWRRAVGVADRQRIWQQNRPVLAEVWAEWQRARPPAGAGDPAPAAPQAPPALAAQEVPAQLWQLEAARRRLTAANLSLLEEEGHLQTEKEKSADFQSVDSGS